MVEKCGYWKEDKSKCRQKRNDYNEAKRHNRLHKAKQGIGNSTGSAVNKWKTTYITGDWYLEDVVSVNSWWQCKSKFISENDVFFCHGPEFSSNSTKYEELMIKLEIIICWKKFLWEVMKTNSQHFRGRVNNNAFKTFVLVIKQYPAQ